MTKEEQGFVQGEKIGFRYGHWCTANGEASSNFRELLNLVEALETQIRAGNMHGAEVFFFTDNLTAECEFYKGNSTWWWSQGS